MADIGAPSKTPLITTDAIQAFSNNSDLRIYGGEHASSLDRRFHDNFFLEVGTGYSRSPLVNFSTSAARLTASPSMAGCRYALTNYFYPPQSLTADFRSGFEPIILG